MLHACQLFCCQNLMSSGYEMLSQPQYSPDSAISKYIIFILFPYRDICIFVEFVVFLMGICRLTKKRETLYWMGLNESVSYKMEALWESPSFIQATFSRFGELFASLWYHCSHYFKQWSRYSWKHWSFRQQKWQPKSWWILYWEIYLEILLYQLKKDLQVDFFNALRCYLLKMWKIMIRFWNT